MKILSINAGSSSFKFKLYEMPEEKILIYGYIEKIGASSVWKLIQEDIIEEYEHPLKNHDEAVKVLIKALIDKKIITSLNDIEAVGHRIVNGAGKYTAHFIEEADIKRLEKIAILSPVHMPGNIAAINAFNNQAKTIKQVAIYDTAFHHTIPKENYMYAVPYEWYEKYGVRKFGFHGISCKYITSQMEKIFKKKVNIIVCHIGSGASVTAIKNSKSFNNSMGFTANEGLIMSTRSGNIDYSILPYISSATGSSLKQLDKLLNTKSGLEGITPNNGDNRDLEKAVEKSDERAVLANTMYINKVVDYIAMYYFKLDKIDALVFTGGVGENSVKFRKEIINHLNKIGIFVDENKNSKISKFSKTNCGIITKVNSAFHCYVIPTDEELMIARDTYNLIKEKV